MTWKKVLLGDILTESKILSTNPDANKRITVRLNCGGVEKRLLRNDKSGGTKYYIRKKGQFIYGQQNFHNGAFGVIPKELDGYESSGDLPTFDISPICKTEWLVYFFKQGAFYRELSHLATGIGSKRIYPEQLFKIEIPLPSIEEQEKLLKAIITAEEKGCNLNGNIEENKNLVKKLRQSILQDAIQGKLVPQDPNDEPASKLLKKIKAEKEQLIKEKKIKKSKDLAPIMDDEIPFSLPKGWVLCRLGDVIDISSGDGLTSYQMIKGDIPVYGGNGITGYHNTYNISKETLVIGRVGYYCGSIHITPDKARVTDNAFITKFDSKIFTLRYLYYLLKGTNLKEDENATAQPVISGKKIYPILIKFPPLAEQQRIVDKVDELMKFCDGLEKEISEAKENGEKLMESVLGEVFR